tara:strand:- start:1064 stop:1207 length:144 start_codon:yes stop_codon:yes gene_type:complete
MCNDTPVAVPTAVDKLQMALELVQDATKILQVSHDDDLKRKFNFETC